MDDEDNRIIMKIALCKTEECLEVIIRSYVPRRNGRVRDSRHMEILRDIRNEEINPCMSPGNRGTVTSMVCSNLITR